MSRLIIYALVDPRSQAIRYIGRIVAAGLIVGQAQGTLFLS